MAIEFQTVADFLEAVEILRREGDSVLDQVVAIIRDGADPEELNPNAIRYGRAALERVARDCIDDGEMQEALELLDRAEAEARA